MLPHKDFSALSTLPLEYGSALYALRDCAGLRARESAFIRGGGVAFGMAAMLMVQRIGAVVYESAGTE